MIVAKTKMKRIPETCKKCSMSCVEKYVSVDSDRFCILNGRECPKEIKPSGNVGYGKPNWCHLMDIELIDDEGD